MKFNLERLEDIVNLTRQLAVGLRDLTFSDNFKGFETEVTVAATTEAQIPNQLSFIPTRFIIVDIDGNAVISKGTTEWTTDFVYLYNNGAAQVTFKVQFFR